MKKRQEFAVGIDVGGSHISSALIDLDTFQLQEKTLFSTQINNKESKEDILNHWAANINQTLDCGISEDIKGIGFAIPGPFDYPNGVAKFEGNDKYESLYNVQIRTAMQQRLTSKDLPIHFFNDAFCFAVGAGRLKKVKAERSIGITLGTGFGASFVKNGQPQMGGAGVPENGCLWNLPFKDGIADDYFSTRWFLSEYKRCTEEDLKGVKEMLNGNLNVTKTIYDSFAQNSGKFLLPYLQDFKAEVLFIGGNISRAQSLFLPKLKEIIKDGAHQISIEVIEETEKANIMGAADLLLTDYWSRNQRLNSYF